MIYHLYAGFDHKYGSEAALVGRFKTLSEAKETKDIEELAWFDEGLRFKISTKAINPGPNISYEKLQEMVMK